MLIRDIITELKKQPPPKAGDTTPHDYNPGWQTLNHLKEEAQRVGNRVAQSHQLFMPRPHPGLKTNRDRRLDNLTNKYAWDEKDPSKLKPDYEKWEDGIKEAAPILKPGKAVTPPGRNKPQADLWTSTAKKNAGGYTSSWVEWTRSEQKAWMAPKGYLYKVKPGALLLRLDSDYDAQEIYRAFYNLGTAADAKDEHGMGQSYAMQRVFPWDQIAKHFDGVYHRGYRGGYGSGNEFLYGWDCESIAWFQTDFLTLVGEVPISGSDYEGDDE